MSLLWEVEATRKQEDPTTVQFHDWEGHCGVLESKDFIPSPGSGAGWGKIRPGKAEAAWAVSAETPSRDAQGEGESLRGSCPQFPRE